MDKLQKSEPAITMSDGAITFNVHGQEVPHLKAYKNDEGSYSMVLDNRLSIVVDKDTVTDMAWFVAQAIAIGQGMSSFSPHAQPLNQLPCDPVEAIRQ